MYKNHSRIHSPGLLGVVVTYGVPLLVILIGAGLWLAFR